MNEQIRTVRVYEENTPPPGEYPKWKAGEVYQLGDIVTGADSALYECTGHGQWCGQAHNEPGVKGQEHWWGATWTQVGTLYFES
ncbi:hypothetical protein JCM19233_5555 [Vibrio astriarenae]|nr:hypothetical protein JCM19233_5555 [Vibrio sp. C7]